MAKKNTNGKQDEPAKAQANGLWTTCKGCEKIIYNKELEENYKICPKCGYYFRLNFTERINLLCEAGSFIEHDKDIAPVNILNFPQYSEKLKKDTEKLNMNDAVVTGEAMIANFKVVMCVLDFNFRGGSMGSVVGEKIARAVENAIKKKLPVIIVSASGGARMEEGIISLMQMAKTSAALGLLHKARLPFISVMTDPTSGGVSASFAMLGDVNIAEPKALIAFAGPRVIQQTIREQLPEGFQMSEFVMEHGMLDIVAQRKELKNTIVKLLTFFV